jgi:hypothetical protein
LTMFLACVRFCCGLKSNNIWRTLPAVWCIHSKIKFKCSFWLVDWTTLMSKLWQSHWHAPPVNFPPVFCTQQTGSG